MLGIWEHTTNTHKKVLVNDVTTAEAEQNKSAWKTRENFNRMPRQRAGYFDQYNQQEFILVPATKDECTKVLLNPESWNKEAVPVLPSSTLEKYPIQEDYCWSDGCLWVLNEYGISNRMSTYKVVIKRAIEEISSTDVTDKYELDITTKNRTFRYSVNKEDFYKLSSLLLKEYPECFVFAKMDEPFREYLFKLIDQFSCHTTKQVLPYKIYHLFGWEKINGKLMYLHAGSKDCDFEVKTSLLLHPNRQNARIFYENFTKAAPAHIAYTLLIYALYAYMAGFYQNVCTDGGCRSMMYLAGRTGSGKTSLVKVLTDWTKSYGLNTELRFDDTIASLQEALFQNNDMLTLVDDFYPKSTKIEQTKFRQKADELTRIIGDGQIKGKMGANRKPLPDRKYRGAIIATGEYVDLGTQSSYLRCFIVSLEKDSVDFRVLSELQGNSNLAQAFFSCWINWLEQNQSWLANWLTETQKESIEFVLNKLKFDYQRLTISIAAILTTVKCFGLFAENNGFAFDVDYVQEFIYGQAIEMHKLVNKMAPEQAVIMAITDGITNGEFIILPSEDAFRRNPKADGYQMEPGKYWIVTSKITSFLKNYSEKNVLLQFGPTLRKILVEAGFLASAEPVKFSKTLFNGETRPRGYIILTKEVNAND